MDLTFCSLKEKEVVNIVDGKKLGRILDIAFKPNGVITGIIVPGDKRFFKNISGCESIFIPWKKIKRIGEDTILVELGDAPPKHDNDFNCPPTINCNV